MAIVTFNKSNDSYYGTNEKDVITVTAKRNATVIGNGGNDTIIVKKGKYHTIYGDDNYYLDKGKGKDSIKITGGTGHRVYAGGGKDTITITGGTGHWVYGYSGNDTITVKKGGGFYLLSGLRGSNRITVQNGAKPGKASDYSTIYGGSGKDIIKVTNKKGKYYDIDGGEGKDQITVTNGSYYEITGDEGNDIIKITNVKHFTVNQKNGFGKDTVTVKGGSNGSIYSAYKSKVTINSGTSHTVTGGGTSSTIVINGGSKIRVEDSEFEKSNETITVNGGSGSMKLERGTDTISFDFKNKTKIGNWEISVSQLNNNRLTVLNAKSTDFTWERKVDRWGLGNAYITAGSDCWVLTNKSTDKSIILSGWSEYDGKTFDIYFKQDNVTLSSVPSTTDWKKLGL